MEYGTYPLAYELGGGLDGLVAVLDEDGDFPGPGRFEDAGELSYSLLKDLRWADVDFGDHDHDWDIERKGDSQMLSKSSVSCWKQTSLQVRNAYLLMPIKPLFAATMSRQ